MPELTATEIQELKSGLYNANSALQHLRTRMESLELTVNQQRDEIIALQTESRAVTKVLEEHELL